MKIDYNKADDEWEWYIGTIYSRIIANIHKSKMENVVELAPGYRHKIAYALKDVDFKGTLYVIDTDADVLEYVKEKYKQLLPEARIICINKEFDKSFSDIPNKLDMFLSNHCVDDLIILEYIKNNYNRDYDKLDFKSMIQKAWVDLGKDATSINVMTNNILMVFKYFFSSKHIDTVIMGQYKSNLYFKDEFKEMDDITYKCFKQIRKLVTMDNNYINKILDFYPFGEDERYRGKYLLDNTQNAGNWIAGTIYKD